MSALTAFILTFGPAAVGAIASLVLDAWSARRGAVVAAAAGLLLSGGAGAYIAVEAPRAPLWDVVIVGSLFSALPATIMLMGGCALLGGLDDLARRPGGGATGALVALGALGAALSACVIDVVALLLALETAAVCGYALVASARTDRSAEAAMKYFIQGAVASVLLVLGVGVFVGLVGSSAYIDLPQPGSLGRVGLGGAILLLGALAFKLGAAPLHSWAPDAYETAPPEAAAFLSSGPKAGVIGALGLLSVGLGAGAGGSSIGPYVAVFAVVSVLVGSLAALRQRSYARMLAYAGVAQAGYALIPIAVFNPSAAALFIATYALGTTGTFIAAAAFRQARPEWDGSIDGLAGIARRMPVLSAAVAVLLVSLAGLPPFVGFYGKFQAFAAAVASGAWWLAAVGLLGSVISLGYYGSVLGAMYLTEEPEGENAAVDEPRRWPSAVLVVVLLAALVTLLGVVPLVAGQFALVSPFLLTR